MRGMREATTGDGQELIEVDVGRVNYESGAKE
jgi:hypothetical protein